MITLTTATTDAHLEGILALQRRNHVHAIPADVSIAETARAAELFLADGVIVTGAATGVPASADDVAEVARAARVPVLVGSGIAPANLSRFAAAHGFIVGSSVKQGGVWCNALDRDAVRAIAELSPGGSAEVQDCVEQARSMIESLPEPIGVTEIRVRRSRIRRAA